MAEATTTCILSTVTAKNIPDHGSVLIQKEFGFGFAAAMRNGNNPFSQEVVIQDWPEMETWGQGSGVSVSVPDQLQIAKPAVSEVEVPDLAVGKCSETPRLPSIKDKRPPQMVLTSWIDQGQKDVLYVEGENLYKTSNGPGLAEQRKKELRRHYCGQWALESGREAKSVVWNQTH